MGKNFSRADPGNGAGSRVLVELTRVMVQDEPERNTGHIQTVDRGVLGRLVFVFLTDKTSTWFCFCQARGSKSTGRNLAKVATPAVQAAPSRSLSLV